MRPLLVRLIGAAALFLSVGAGFYAAIYGVNAQNIRKPFIANLLIEHNVNGTMMPAVYITEAQGRDGSWVTDTLLAEDASKARAQRQVCLRSAGTITSYDPETNLAVGKVLTPARMQILTAPIPKDCLQANPGPGTATCVDEGQKFLGYPVMKLTREFDAGEIHHKLVQLVAPALDFKALEFTRFDDKGSIRERRTAISLAEGDPAPGMFEIPAAAIRVAKASEFIGPSEARRGRTTQPSGLELMDQRFANKGK